MAKFVKRAVIVILVLIVVGLIVGFLMIDVIATRVVRDGGTYALDVPTDVESVNLTLTRGETSVDNLMVSNPQDPAFTTPHFMKLKRADIAVSLGTLRKDEIVIPRFELNGLEMYLEKDGAKSNYGTIINNLKRFESEEKPEQQPEEAGPTKHVTIKEFVIKDLLVHAKMKGEGLASVAGMDAPIRIEEIRLKDVGTKSSSDQLVAQLWDVVMKAVLEATFQKATQLPAAILKDLGGSLEGLSDLGVEVIGEAGQIVGDVAGKATDEAKKAIEGATKGVGDAAKGAGDEAKKAVDDVGKTVTDGLGGLLGGDKNKEEEQSE